jgi:P4 family phage/plasmid primase-like protien
MGNIVIAGREDYTTYYNKKLRSVPDRTEYDRVNAVRNASLGCFRRAIRHTLAKDNYVDIDVANCHPTMLLQLCQKYDIDCKSLMGYVENRDAVLNGVMGYYDVTRDIAKNLFIRLLYFGSVKTWMNEFDVEDPDHSLPFIESFTKELREIGNELVKHNQDLFKLNRDRTNPVGSTVSFILQEYERRVLEVMYQYVCDHNGVSDDCILCYDGIMIPTKSYEPELLDELTKEVRKKVGFKLNFTVKDMDEGYQEEIKDIVPIKFAKNFDFANTPFNTKTVAVHFAAHYSTKFIYCDKKLYYFNGVYWQIDEAPYCALNIVVGDEYFDLLFAQFRKYEDIIVRKNADSESKEWRKKLDKLRSQVYDLQTNKKREDFIKEFFYRLKQDIDFDSKPHLFVFKDRIFDLDQNKFTTPNPLDYVSLTTGYNYDDNYDTETNVAALKKLLRTIFPDATVEKYALTVLASGLHGDNAERIFTNSGVGGNGKGVLNELALEMVGDYGYRLPSSVLTQALKQGGNPEVANLDGKRLVICQEPDARSNNKICTATIKELTGGNKLNARQLYSNKTSIQLCLTLILECNKKLLLDDVTAADMRRVEEIPFEAKFVDKATYDSYSDDEKEGCSVGDPYYKTLQFRIQYRQALFEILREHYATYRKEGFVPPAKCKECKEKYLRKSDVLYSWVMDNMDKSDDRGVNEKLKDVYERFRFSDTYQSMEKAEKQKYTKAKFVEELEQNVFLKRYIVLDHTRTKLIRNFKLKPNDDDY